MVGQVLTKSWNTAAGSVPCIQVWCKVPQGSIRPCISVLQLNLGFNTDFVRSMHVLYTHMEDFQESEYNSEIRGFGRS